MRISDWSSDVCSSDLDAATLASANGYTDTVAVQTLDAANTYTDAVFAQFNSELDTIREDVDRRFRDQDRRIDKLAAMSGAYAGMAMNTAGLAGANRIGVGVGGQNGERSEEHTSELQSLMRNSYAVYCLKIK